MGSAPNQAAYIPVSDVAGANEAAALRAQSTARDLAHARPEAGMQHRPAARRASHRLGDSGVVFSGRDPLRLLDDGRRHLGLHTGREYETVNHVRRRIIDAAPPIATLLVSNSVALWPGSGNVLLAFQPSSR